MCRYVWNREAVRVWREVAGEKPSVSFYSPGKRFTQRRRETPRLQEPPFAPVHCTLKHQADAWQRAFAGGGFPRFRSRRGDHCITFLTDGGDTVLNLAADLSPCAEHVLDWFHITMRLTVLGQYAKGLAHHDEAAAHAAERELKRIKGFLWNGNHRRRRSSARECG